MKVALKDQVGRNVLSYVNDIIVASKKKTSYISDLAETFTNIREASAQAQPKKMCVWRHKRQSTWLPSVYERHQSKSR
jgi:hypothetical protein